MMTGFDTIIYNKEAGIGYITLNRPQVLNAYNIKMRDELYQALGAVADDPEIQVLVLKGAGERAFSVGADLTEFLTAPSRVIARRVRWQRDVWGRFLGLPQPAIAALHGFVLGSGVEMALCCDLRIAAEDARFGLPEVALGMIPAAGGTQTLPRATGTARALELLGTGNWIDAREARRIGLVNKVVPRHQLMAAIDETARQLLSKETAVLRAMKQAVNLGLDMSLAEALELERHLADQLLASVL